MIISPRDYSYAAFTVHRMPIPLFGEIYNIINVLPLFKKDDPSVATNYRPVSLLSCVSKIMERIIFKHVYNYFIKNNLFYKYQAGFLHGHSTLYQLLETYHSIVKAIDDSSWPSSIFDVC